jgi:hypothetical protein
MRIWSIPTYCLILMSTLISCRDPFEPELREFSTEILVVEGFIELEGESIIKLTKTSPIQSENTENLVSSAFVALSDGGNNRWDFVEMEEGIYSLEGSFSENGEYLLHIQLSNGHTYRSEPLIPVITPEIEVLDYLRDEDGVEIFVSTRGTETAQYFLWTFEEHWIFQPGVITQLIYDNGGVRRRTEDERIDRCWDSNVNPYLVLQNSARFEDNRILQRELVRIPNFSEKLTQRYSIEVKQMAIDQTAFDFWDILRRNSEDIGGIFSPLPSLINGNIQALSEGIPQAIGHISMGKTSTKRIYIDLDDVFPWPVFIPEYEFCFVLNDTIPPNAANIQFAGGNLIPARDIFNEMGALLGYRASTQVCTDCTLRGTNVRPDFWEER